MRLDNDDKAGSKRLDKTAAADWLDFADLFLPSVDLLTIDDRNMAGSIEKRINGEREKVRKFWPISSCGSKDPFPVYHGNGRNALVVGNFFETHMSDH